MTSTRLTPVGVLRVLLIGYRMHLKMLATSAFNGVLQVIWPLFFATVGSVLNECPSLPNCA